MARSPNAWLPVAQYLAAVMAGLSLPALLTVADGRAVERAAFAPVAVLAGLFALIPYIGARLLMRWLDWEGFIPSVLMGAATALGGAAVAGLVVAEAAAFHAPARVWMMFAIGGVVGGLVHWGLAVLALPRQRVVP